MDLYVMRHGLAGRHDAGRFSNDDERPLTGKGRRQIVRQAKGLNEINLTLDAIVTSPLTRSLQTAERIHKRLLSPGRLITSAALRPSEHPSALMEELATDYSSASSLMIVGHEPYLSHLIAVIVAGEPWPLIRLRKGALCKLRIPSPKYRRCGWIEWSMTAAQMVKLA